MNDSDSGTVCAPASGLVWTVLTVYSTGRQVRRVFTDRSEAAAFAIARNDEIEAHDWDAEVLLEGPGWSASEKV